MTQDKNREVSRIADEIRCDGYEAEIVPAVIDNVEGWTTVTCEICHRIASLPSWVAVPPGKVAVCPDCAVICWSGS